MNKSEDYLDSLLNNVTPERKAESKRKRRRRKANFEEDFENELNGAVMDDFMQTMENEADQPTYADGSDDSFFDELEGILNQAKEPEPENELPIEQPEEAFEINTLSDDAWTERKEPEEPEELAEQLEEPETPQVEMFVDLSEVDELLEEESGKGRAAQKGSDKEQKQGLFKKLGAMLFGGDEEKESEESEKPTVAEMNLGGGNADDLDDENLKILQELDMAGMPEEAPAEAPQEKGKKKKEKKMKKEKKAKEKKVKEKKPKKPKKAKPKKEQKPKKAKAVDLSPPLPKVPVILIFVMAVSGTLFILLSSNLLGYSASINAAKEAYAARDYVEAYREIAGITPKTEDEEFSGRLLLLARVQGELNNANALYENGQYTMALDAYICALGRYDVNYEDAAVYGAQAEYDNLAAQVETQMSDKFGIDAATAREIYGLTDRAEYTYRVYHIVKDLGLIG